jgi:prepilin-type processing-associated H-X9-DG protein
MYGTQPMQSLALLYPTYLADPEVFGCPSTEDSPDIQVLYQASPYIGQTMRSKVGPWGGWTGVTQDTPAYRATNFGAPFLDMDGIVRQNARTGYVDHVLSRNEAVEPTRWDGRSARTQYKSSYWYDNFLSPSKSGPGQAVAADGDGMTWRRPDGARAVALVPYKDSGFGSWDETPKKGWREQDAQHDPGAGGDYTLHEFDTEAGYWHRNNKPNHQDGQNVMYFDGHVKWTVEAYVSDDPKDNIWAPNTGDPNKDNLCLPTHGLAQYMNWTDGAWDTRVPYDVWGVDTDAWIWNEMDVAGVQYVE